MKNMYGMKEESKVEEIREDIRDILTGFLEDEHYQETFKDMALALGYKGDDVLKVRASLFTVNSNGEIGFCLAELNDMFLEYQTIQNIKDVEPYKSLLQNYPERRTALANLAKKLLDGEAIEQEDLQKVFY
jgi:hypothetical protein